MSRVLTHWRRIAAAVGVIVAALVVVAAVNGTGGGNVRTFCDAARSGEDPLVLFGAYKPGDLEMGNPQLDKALDRLRELYESSPTQIEESLKALVEAGEEIAHALKARAPGAATGGDPGPLPELNLDQEKLAEAGTVVMTFAKDKCDVTLGTETSTPTTAPP